MHDVHAGARRGAAVLRGWLVSAAVILAGCGTASPAGPGPAVPAVSPVPVGTTGPAPTQRGGIADQIGRWDPQASVIAAVFAGLVLLAAVLNFLRVVYTDRLDAFHLTLVLVLVCIAATVGFAAYYIHA